MPMTRNLGECSTVFQTEIFAILKAAEMLEELTELENNVGISSNNKAALKKVCRPRSRTVLVNECGNALDRLTENREGASVLGSEL